MRRILVSVLLLMSFSVAAQERYLIDWDDVGEAIFSGQALVAGANNLNFTIPVGAIEGTTYSRFRCTTDGVVLVTGEASDGEVEDYTVTIGPATNSEFPFQMFLPAIIPKNK